MQTPEPATREVLSSDFWGCVTLKQNTSKKPSLPNVPTLDQDGPLPEGAYFKSYQNQQRCRIGVALDIPSLWVSLKEESIESNQIVGKLQNYVDSGFHTFHLRCQTPEQQQWAEENIVGKFYSETPSFCRNQCHFTIPFSIPQITKGGTTAVQRSQIRQSILETLDRTGAEVIDCLQLKGFSSPYAFDILDILQDLQREGILQSIDAYQLPMTQQMLAREYGFSLDTMHWDANLLDMTKYQEQLFHNQQTKQDNPLILTTPLAGGLLTERYLGQNEMLQSWQFRWMERYYWNTIYDDWANKRRRRNAIKNAQQQKGHKFNHDDEVEDMDNKTLWVFYQTQLLSSLNRIARKHSVSVPSVVLRWILQLDHVSGTIVTCQLLYPDDGLVRKPRERQLRQVFTFALDEEDMNELWELTGLDRHDGDAEELELFDEMMEGSNGLFLPSKKLRM